MNHRNTFASRFSRFPKRLHWVLLIGVFSLVLVFTAAFAMEEDDVGPLPEDPPATLFASVDESLITAQEREMPQSPQSLRFRFVHPNFQAMGTLESPAARITVNLFEDVSFTATFERTETNVMGSYVWIGRIPEIEMSQVILVKHKGLLAGSVSMPQGIYEIQPIRKGLSAVVELDQSRFPPEREPIVANVRQTILPQDITRATDTCDEITVLVAYSPEARAAAGGTAQIEALIAQAVAETNQSYINSQMVQRITLVHTMETQAGDAQNDFDVDLNALRVLTDGVFDDVDAARETYYADLVALIIENNSSCGLGYLNSTAATAFSVTHRECATGYYSFGHELGHNMGARHDWYVDDNTTTGYNKGFVNLPDRWRTIMAYNSMCSANGTSCTRLQYWSNPNVQYGGDPMGVASTGPTNCVAGQMSPDPSTCAADNHLRLNNTCSTVANFRDSPDATPTNTPTPVVTDTPTPGPTNTPTPGTTPAATDTPTPQPTDTPTPTSTPTPTPLPAWRFDGFVYREMEATPTPTPPSIGALELLTNGDFESGVLAPWQTEGGVRMGAGRRTMHGAWLGGADSNLAQLEQTVAILAGTGTLNLRFWWQAQTLSAQSGTADTLEVRATYRGRTTTLLTLSAQPPFDQWHEEDVDLSDLITSFGTAAAEEDQLTLTFVLQSDTTLSSQFGLDDITLSACCVVLPPPEGHERFYLPLIYRLR